MIAVPRRRRGRALVLTAAASAVLALLGACTSGSSSAGSGQLGQQSGPVASPGGGGGTPTSTPTTTGTPTTTPSTPHTSPPASHAYPSDYPLAVLTAWAARDHAYLALLTSTSAANTMFGWGNINTHWTFVSGEGAAGSDYSSYYNNGGDFIVIRTVNQLTSTHQWHAATIQTWDQMKFPAGPTDYAKELVSGWMTGNQARMNYLGTTALTTLLLGMTPPGDSYTATYHPSIKEVEIQDGSTGTDISFIVDTTKLSGHNAITGCDIGC
jgi:hypothetical protein